MYMGGIAGLMGAFVYENGTENPIGIVGVIISMLCALIASGLGALIYSVLTITLRANQNVTGLALTTFGGAAPAVFGSFLLHYSTRRRVCQALSLIFFIKEEPLPSKLENGSKFR